jgi:hypothetical protein
MHGSQRSSSVLSRMRDPPFAFLLLTLAYVVSGRLGLLLAVPSGYGSAIFPPAGIAVAAMGVRRCRGPSSAPSC